MLSLKISVVDYSMVKTMQFDPSTTVYDATRIIREKIPEFKGEGRCIYIFLYVSVDFCYILRFVIKRY